MGNSIFNQDSNTGSSHSDVGMPVMAGVGGVKDMDPSPEKPVQSARTPTERKRKRKNNPGTPVDTGSAPPLTGSESGGKGVKKINEYFSKHNPSSPVRSVPP